MRRSQLRKSPRRPGRPTGPDRGVGRAALLGAARELLAEQGVARMTSRAVAERAGVKPTLVNYYFGDHRGLLHAVLAETAAETAQRLEGAVLEAGSLEERLTRLMDAMLRGFALEPFMVRLLFEQVIFAEDAAVDRFVEQFGRAHFEAIRGVLEDGRSKGRFRDVDPEIALALIGGVCLFFGAASPLLERLMPVEPLTTNSVAGIARRCAELILSGLARPQEAIR